MIKAKAGLTWKFNWILRPSIQQIKYIKGNKCKVINLIGNAPWGRKDAELVPIKYIEDCLNLDGDYKVITHYNTKLGKILYK